MRIRQGWTITHTANLLEISAARYKRWEQGEQYIPKAYEHYLNSLATTRDNKTGTSATQWTPEAITLLREGHNLSQTAFALKMGVSRTTIQKWEKGLMVPGTSRIAKLIELERELRS
jgi:DNA-binding transcriptional regulator YiaG